MGQCIRMYDYLSDFEITKYDLFSRQDKKHEQV